MSGIRKKRWRKDTITPKVRKAPFIDQLLGAFFAIKKCSVALAAGVKSNTQE